MKVIPVEGEPTVAEVSRETFETSLAELRTMAEQLGLTVQVGIEGSDENPYRSNTKGAAIFDILANAGKEGLTLSQLTEKLVGMGVYDIHDATTEANISMYFGEIEKKMTAQTGKEWYLERRSMRGSRKLIYSMPQ